MCGSVVIFDFCLPHAIRIRRFLSTNENLKAFSLYDLCTRPNVFRHYNYVYIVVYV